MSKWLYLCLDAGSALVPFIFSFHPKLKFNNQFRFAFPAMALTALFFIVWDSVMTRFGVWGFNDRYVSGVYVFNLPFEEILFFICIPFACLFTFHCLRFLRVGEKLEGYSKVISSVVAICLAVVGVLNFASLYTSSTFISLAVVITLLQFAFCVKWLGQFYFSFLVLLIPFFIVNGILTGTGLQEPVVWYNDHENLGLRLLTIPVEDIFYGMLLQLINVTFYELLRKPYDSH